MHENGITQRKADITIRDKFVQIFLYLYFLGLKKTRTIQENPVKLKIKSNSAGNRPYLSGNE